MIKEKTYVVGEVRPDLLGERGGGQPFRNVVYGREIQISMPNKEKRTGHFVIMNLDQIIASHDEESFSSSPDFPVNEWGHNINDRNYQGDPAAQQAVHGYARDLEPERLVTTSRTPSGTPIVTRDGFVVSGNNRTMSAKYAKTHFNDKWKEYQRFLREEIDSFGIHPTEVNSVPNPFLVRIDHDFPEYTTQELSKYNIDTKKSERPIDRAIKLSNILRENEKCAEIIAHITGEFETFTDFYGSRLHMAKLIKTLTDFDIISEQETPAFWTGMAFTAAGKELVENLLASLILDRDALFASEQEGIKQYKRKILTALPVLMKNVSLPEGSLRQYINDAIILQYKIRSSGLDFVDFVRQYNIFDDKYDKQTVYMNRLLNKGKIVFKQAIEGYNESIITNQGTGLFGPPPTLQEIFEHHIVGVLDDTDIRLIEASNIISKTKPAIKPLPTKEKIMEPEENIIDQVVEKSFSISGDSFFTDHPEKMLGEPYEASGLHGKVTKYKGDASALDKIDTPDNFSASEISGGALSSMPQEDLQGEVATGKIADTAIDNAIKESPKDQAEKKRKKIQEAREFDEAPSDKELLSFSDVVEKYNPDISNEEMKAFLWHKHQNGQTMCGGWLSIFNPAPLTQDQEAAYVEKWVKDGILCFHDGELLPAYLYFAENVYQRQETLAADKSHIVELYGQDVFIRQQERLQSITNELIQCRLRLDDPDPDRRLKILPVSDFAKEFTITSLADEKPFEAEATKRAADYGNIDFLRDMAGYMSWSRKQTYDQLTLYDAFMLWINKYRSEVPFKQSTWIDIIRYYLWKIQYNEKRDGDRANYERKKSYAREDGNRLFALFLSDIIKDADKEAIEALWNKRFNGYRKIDYSKVPIGFRISAFYPNGEPMDIRHEKREAIAFNFSEGSGLLAYQVGLGKTWSAIFAIAQFLEAGYCKRPFLVVPNQTYKQWISEIRGMLPHIKINDLYNLSQDYIDELTGKDGIEAVAPGSISIMTEEGFRRLTFGEITASRMISQLTTILSQQVDADPDSKQSKRQAEAFKAKLESVIGRGQSKGVVMIEDVGFDYMVIDEAHSMKKVFTSIKGRVNERQGKQIIQKDYEISAGTPSTLALKGFIFSQYILKNNGNKNILLLTATPFTNSPLEVYSMLSLIAYHKLEGNNLANLNDFFDTFCAVSYELVINAQLKPEKRQIFKGFDNLVGLQQLIFRFMNYKEAGKTDERGNMVKLVRPDKYVLPLKSKIIDGKKVAITEDEKIDTHLPMSPEQKSMMDDIISYVQGDISFSTLSASHRATQANVEDQAKDDDETQDTTEGVEIQETDLNDDEKRGVRMLRGVNFARSLALSPYLYEYSGLSAPTYKSYIETSPKLQYIMECVRSVREYHIKNKQPISGQVIYMDRGKKYFSLIRDYLVDVIGYKKHEVGIIKSGMTAPEIKAVISGKGISNQKEYKDYIKNRFLGVEFDNVSKMFKDIPDPERIKIIIGSSSIKEGMNLQRHSTCLFNGFLDWNPTDIIQLEGRVWRQGNRFKAVRIINPLMEDSMDIFMFQKLEEKTSRINAIWNYDGKTNVLATDEFDPSELKYTLIKDPKLIAQMQIEEIREGVADEISGLNNTITTLERAKEAISVIGSRTDDLRNIVDKFTPSKHERSAASLVAAFKKLLRDQKDSSGRSFKSWGNEPGLSRWDYSIDYSDNLTKPHWYDGFISSLAQIAKIKKDYLNPNNIKDTTEEIDRYKQKVENNVKDKEAYIKTIQDEKAVGARVLEIQEERRRLDYKPANLKDRVNDFKKLNNLLSEVREPARSAEQFKIVENDMCPPIKDGVRLTDKKSVDMLERCIKDLPQTKDMHTLTGTDEYKEDRMKLHDKIIADMRSHSVCITQGEPIAILTGGVPGSGKSTFLKKFAPFMQSDKILTIDADAIREKLPEYQGWNSAITHRETKDIYMKMFDDIQEGQPCKYDILWDGTMNKTKNYIPLIRAIQAIGYKVFVIFLDVPFAISKKRVLDRYKKSGRYVPKLVIEEANKAGLKAFDVIKEMVTGYMLVDGETMEIKEKHGESIPEDRKYFDTEYQSKERKKKVARAKAIQQKQRLRLMEID